jgi:hypothetical protein
MYLDLFSLKLIFIRCGIGVVLIFSYKLSFRVIIVYSSFIIFVKYYYYRGSFRSVPYYIIISLLLLY